MPRDDACIGVFVGLGEISRSKNDVPKWKENGEIFIVMLGLYGMMDAVEPRSHNQLCNEVHAPRRVPVDKNSVQTGQNQGPNWQLGQAAKNDAEGQENGQKPKNFFQPVVSRGGQA